MKIDEILRKRKKELEQAKEDLYEQIKVCENDIIECDSVLQFYEKSFLTSQTSSISNVGEYSAKKEESRIKWKSLVYDCLVSQNILMRTSEMVDILFPDKNIITKKEYVLLMSSSLNGLCANGYFKSIHYPGISGYFYGLLEMFDGDVPKDQFIPNMIKKEK